MTARAPSCRVPSSTGLRLLLAATACLAAGAAQAKPLYLTVNRAYRPGERPSVDVAFERRGPVELRVVRPDALEEFLARQTNLRRAYEQPTTTENPGRHLSRGLNAVRTPGTFLYRALGEDFRRALAPAMPDREGSGARGDVVALAEGPEKLVSVPAGTTLVQRQWLNLDLGGTDRDFNVPGFEIYGRSYGWEERKVELDPLPAGIYLVQLVQGRVEGQVILVVSDLAVQVKQTDGELLVRVAGGDLAPLRGAEVRVRTPGGAGPSGTTDERGEFRLQTREPRVLVLVRSGSDTAVVDTDFYSTLAAAPDVFVYTDRPIYRPGDTIRFRGLVRQPDAFLSRLFTPRRRDVLVSTEAGGRKLEARAKVDEFGAFEGSLALPEDAEGTVARLDAQLDGKVHSAEARVQSYVKPTFYLEVSGDSEIVRPGEALKAKVRARRYAGGAPANTRYDVFLYRTELEGPAWVDDAGLGGQGSAVTYGTTSTTEGKLAVPERLYSSVDARGQAYAEDPWETAPVFDANGEATVEIPVPALAPGDERRPWKYSVSVRARDDQGAFANGGRPYFLAPSEVLGTLRPSTVLALEGGEATLAVRATSLSGAAYANAKGTVEYALRRADGSEKKLDTVSIAADGGGTWRGTMPTPGAGTVIARVTLQDRAGHPWSGEATLLVAGLKGEEAVRVPSLQVTGRGGTLAPGDQAELVALFPAGWGPGGKDRGKAWLTLSGTGLHETRLVDVDGVTLVHRFEIERRFGSTVHAALAYPTAAGRWVERTIPFRIVPPERVLTVKLASERPEASPLGTQTVSLRVTDHRGQGVKAQVSLGVVDKAIYALQGEFRPRALDFFYPLVRNNVGTFTSSEFQGYGYGEELARLLRRAGTSFAAVKPPTVTREVDTAYWNPSVVTDEDGLARVTFALPANQTLWTVTAVAADASGRFGEATSEFATRAGTTLVAAAPQFLREGDRAVASVRLGRGEKGPAGELALTVDLSGEVKAGQVAERVTLSAGGERVVPFELTAARPGVARIALAASGGDRPLTDRRELPVRTTALEEVVATAGFGGGRLELALPPGAEVQSVRVLLRPSTLALAVSQLEDLLVYPHGCLEQLVATTIPNIALYRTLETAGAYDALDPRAKALVSEARSRSAQGLERILALARPGGGFAWWPGDDGTSVPLTLIALDGLAHAVDAGLVPRSEPRLVDAAAWLATREDLPLPLDATRTYVLARLDGARQAPHVRALLDRVADASQPDMYPIALAALAAEKAGIADEPPVRARLDVLAARAKDTLARGAGLVPGEAYFGYPLRLAGLTAVVAHAASLREPDLSVTRRRLAEVLSDRHRLSTFERATVILHSLWLVERDARTLRAGPPPAVQAEGTGAVQPKVQGAGFAADLPATTRAVRVDTFEGQAELRAVIRVPAASAQPVAEGMSLERAYHRVLPGGGLQKLAPGETVRQGDELFVELTLDAHEDPRWRTLRSAYYVVQDAIPAGFTPLQEDKAWRGPPYDLPLAHEALKRRTFTAERATFYFSEPAYWSRTPHRLGYVIRADFAGRFTAPPATLEDMYAPAVRARTAGATLEVAPSGAGKRTP
ncbi:MAG: MG2 domain-containing protein [Anaeromyxobacter sp.]